MVVKPIHSQFRQSVIALTENNRIHYHPVFQRCDRPFSLPFLALSIVLIDVTIQFYFWVALFPIMVKFKFHFPAGFVL